MEEEILKENENEKEDETNKENKKILLEENFSDFKKKNGQQTFIEKETTKTNDENVEDPFADVTIHNEPYQFQSAFGKSNNFGNKREMDYKKVDEKKDFQQKIQWDWMSNEESL